jgi:general secretion pathway protein E
VIGGAVELIPERAPAERRVSRRTPVGDTPPGRLRTARGECEVVLLDRSAGGLRVRGLPNAGPLPWLRPDDAVQLTADGPGAAAPRLARVVWGSPEHGEFGLAWIASPAQDGAARGRLDLDTVRLDPACALRLPASVALRRRILPLCTVEGRVVVACADPEDRASLAVVERQFECPAEPRAAHAEQILRELKRVHGEPRAAEGRADDAVALCDELLQAANLRRASDIHLCPERDGLHVRLRVDGQLELYRRLASAQQPELLSRIKVLAGMDIAERRAPQDGRFRHEFVGGEPVEVRVATLPTNHGERATLRLLGQQAETLQLDRLGLRPAQGQVLERALRRPHGLVLATGPTGSGKTTTLYAALRHILASRAVNAVAVLDPVEYDLPGVTQVEVDAGQKLGFATALRSLLRHDPDVILVGEIRDGETAELALRAALTGHLVLSTLHTTDAVGAVARLLDLGVAPYLVAATLRAVVAQRLVRQLCSACRRPVISPPAELPGLGLGAGGAVLHFRPGACVHCAGRGFGGRSGLFEVLDFDAELAELLQRGGDGQLLRARWTERGGSALLDDGRAKLLDGTTPYDELAAVLGL